MIPTFKATPSFVAVLLIECVTNVLDEKADYTEEDQERMHRMLDAQERLWWKLHPVERNALGLSREGML